MFTAVYEAEFSTVVCIKTKIKYGSRVVHKFSTDKCKSLFCFAEIFRVFVSYVLKLPETVFTSLPAVSEIMTELT